MSKPRKIKVKLLTGETRVMNIRINENKKLQAAIKRFQNVHPFIEIRFVNEGVFEKIEEPYHNMLNFRTKEEYRENEKSYFKEKSYRSGNKRTNLIKTRGNIIIMKITYKDIKKVVREKNMYIALDAVFDQFSEEALRELTEAARADIVVMVPDEEGKKHEVSAAYHSVNDSLAERLEQMVVS